MHDHHHHHGGVILIYNEEEYTALFVGHSISTLSVRDLLNAYIIHLVELQMIGTYMPFGGATKDSIPRLIILTLPEDYVVLNVDVVLNVIVIIIIFSLQIFSRKTVEKYTQVGIYCSLSWYGGQAETETIVFLSKYN